MSDFISFDITVNACMRFNVTKSAVDRLMEMGLGRDWFREQSKGRRLLITQDKEENNFSVHLRGCVLKCVVANDETGYYLVIKYIQEENYHSKNTALNSGLCFCLEKGIIFSYSAGERSFHYAQGKAATQYNAKVNSRELIKLIKDEFRKKGNITPSEEDEEFQPTPELTRYLDIAENYAEAQYQLEENKALKNEPMYYDSIAGAEYARLDNSAYRFYVSSLNEKIFTVNTTVELDRCDFSESKLQATIVDFGYSEDKRAFVDLLFNEQVTIETIAPVGRISLSLSSVNRDVQLSAIRKIEEGTADSKYMNDILGESKPQGFNNENLSKLKKSLRERKHRPNESQIDGIEKGINSKDVYLVMGPPGTGKTTVILEWIKYFVKEKKMRVLISSQNNKAVDNVLERIVEEEGIDALRIGNESKVAEEIKPCLFELKLANLRKKIENSTNGHINKIKEFLEHWKSKYQMFMTLKDEYITKKSLEDTVSKECTNLFGMLNQIETVAFEFRYLLDRIQRFVQKINAQISREIAYRNKGIIWRFLFKPVSFIRNIFISYRIGIYDEKNAYLNSLVMQHNELRIKFMEKYDYVVFDVFSKECELKEEIGEKYANLNLDLNTETDKWGFMSFDKCKGFEVTDYGFFESLSSSMSGGISKAQNLEAELVLWQDASINTSNYTLQKILLDSVNLVGATCIGINSQRKFANLKFDVTIIDEAGQIQIHNALVPMSVSNKLIMLGDHKQIPPTADAELVNILKQNSISSELLEKSLFEEMYNNLPDENKSMLDTQYRMPGEIADVISNWFYGGQYKSFEEKRNLDSIVPKLTDKPFLIIDTSNSGDKRYETSEQADDQTIHYNTLEADIASEIASVLTKKGYDTEDMGIIAALKAQVELIKSMLKKKGVPADSINELAATLDSYQGQERDIIIYSFGRSSKTPPERQGVGFLKELRRLNVAMSRCKKALIMIGDMKFLSERQAVTDKDGNLIMDVTKTEKNFGDFIRYMLNCVSDGAGEIIDVETFSARINAWKEDE